MTTKVLGVEIAGSTIILALVELTPGAIAGGQALAVPAPGFKPYKMPFPVAGQTNGENLQLLIDAFSEVMQTTGVDKVAFVEADDTSGVARTKIEAALELAAHRRRITAIGIHAVSIAKFRKKPANALLIARLLTDGPVFAEKARLCVLRAFCAA